MTTPATPPSSKAADAAAATTDTALTFEDRLRIFWQKNGRSVLALLVAVLIVILAKGGWDYVESQREVAIEGEYAAATTPEKLRAFATAHAGHPLAAVVRLRLADDAYAAGKGAEAVAGYEEAISALKTGPLAARARLGLAMAKLQAGKTADGELALKQLASDLGQPRAIRAEASYQLASLANSAGKYDEVRKYADQILQIDPMSNWTQRAFMLRANLPAETAPAAAAASPAPAAADSAIKLPGK